jgi:hypothetical protein
LLTFKVSLTNPNLPSIGWVAGSKPLAKELVLKGCLDTSWPREAIKLAVAVPHPSRSWKGCQQS